MILASAIGMMVDRDDGEVRAGKASGTWKLMRPDKLGQTRACGHVSMRCAWLPALLE